jgi:hypothetical protein
MANANQEKILEIGLLAKREGLDQARIVGNNQTPLKKLLLTRYFPHERRPSGIQSMRFFIHPLYEVSPLPESFLRTGIFISYFYLK